MIRKQQKESVVKKIAIDSSIAAVLGYLVGVLTAPKSGKKVRKDIKHTTDRARIDSEKQLKQLSKELTDAIGDVKSHTGSLSSKAERDLKSTINKSLDTKEKIREVISAIHAGDADDDDLKRSIKNAKLAIEHLRDFLHK